LKYSTLTFLYCTYCSIQTYMIFTICLFMSTFLADYDVYWGKNAYNGVGAIEIDSDNSAPAGQSAESCQRRCDAENLCDCVTFRKSDGKCWMRAACVPSLFGDGGSSYDTYVRMSKPEDFKWISDISQGNGGIYQLEARTYYIDKQYQLPPNTEIHGSGSGGTGTVIAAKGYSTEYLCQGNAANRKGFLLGSHNYVGNLHFIGMDKMRLRDNQLLCGGAPFETPGCAGTGYFDSPPGWCGGDLGIGKGVKNVTLEDISIEKYSVQSMFYANPTKAGVDVSQDITITNLRSDATWADGMNIHGAHKDILVQDCYVGSSGDDSYAIWSVGALADNITFKNNVGVNPWFRNGGSSAPTGYSWSDNCFAVYGGKSSTFIDNSCAGGNDANVIFGNNMHKTYGGSFDDSSSTKVQGNNGKNPNGGQLPACYFGVWFPSSNAKGCQNVVLGKNETRRKV